MDVLVELQQNVEPEYWLKGLNEFFHQHKDASSFESIEPKVIVKLHDELKMWTQDIQKYHMEIGALLAVVRILMRQRDQMEIFLSIDAMNMFVGVLESKYGKSRMYEEALKCSINAIYDRPAFVIKYINTQGLQRMVHLLEISQTATFHALVCKWLVYACGETTEAIHELKGSCHVISILVPMLAYVIRHDSPTFPKGMGRCSLVEEILKLLFALGTIGNHLPTNEVHTETMTQLGVLLCEMVFLPNHATAVFELKLQVMHVLLHMPADYANYLVASHAISPIVGLLHLLLDKIQFEKIRKIGDVASTIIVLHKIATNSMEGKRRIQHLVFPPEDDAQAMKLRQEQMAIDLEALQQLPTEDERKLYQKEIQERTLHPEYAPISSLRYKLFKLMTCLDSNVKRCSSELIYTLCDQNVEEFTRRTGMGNAIAMLQLKGIV